MVINSATPSPVKQLAAIPQEKAEPSGTRLIDWKKDGDIATFA